MAIVTFHKYNVRKLISLEIKKTSYQIEHLRIASLFLPLIIWHLMLQPQHLINAVSNGDDDDDDATEVLAYWTPDEDEKKQTPLKTDTYNFIMMEWLALNMRYFWCWKHTIVEIIGMLN